MISTRPLRPVRKTSHRGVRDIELTMRETWGSADDGGRALPSGLYFIRMEAPGYKTTRKVVLAR